MGFCNAEAEIIANAVFKVGHGHWRPRPGRRSIGAGMIPMTVRASGDARFNFTIIASSILNMRLQKIWIPKHQTLFAETFHDPDRKD